MYFGGAGYYYGKQPNEMLNSSYGVLFKNGEAIEIDPDCTTIYALAVSSAPNALQEKEKVSWEVYPNPAKDNVVVNNIEPAEVQVYNALGQLVKTVQGTNAINVGTLPEGMYLLRIADKKGNAFLERIVKE